ncbi:hypothetical protein EDD11_010050, partial [Mortierella claussenii]
ATSKGHTVVLGDDEYLTNSRCSSCAANGWDTRPAKPTGQGRITKRILSTFRSHQ